MITMITTSIVILGSAYVVLHVKLFPGMSCEKTTFNKKEILITSKLGLTFKEGTSKVAHLEHSWLWCWSFDILESRNQYILPIVFYGCETCSLTLRGERKLRVFENMVLRRIFGPRREKVTWEWRRLPNKKLNDLHSSPNIVLVIKSSRW